MVCVNILNENLDLCFKYMNVLEILEDRHFSYRLCVVVYGLVSVYT